MISVVTIAYNNLAGLQLTGASLASQVNVSFRWIVIDGGSSDGSSDFIARQSIYKSVSEPDRGIYDAMQKGLALCDSEYILFLNAGDELHAPDSLATAMAQIADHDVYFFDTVVQTKGKSWFRKARPLASARYSVPAVQQSTIYRTEALRNLSWPTEYKICGDYCLAAQLLASRATAVSRGLILSRFQLGGISTESFLALCSEAADIQKRYLRVPIWRRSFDFLRRFVTGCAVWVVHRTQSIWS